MDLAVVSEVRAGREVVLQAVGGPAFGFVPGSSRPLENTVCQHLLDGLIANVVPDVEAEPVLREVRVVRERGIRAYVGVPLTDLHARLLVLCCLARAAHPELVEADARSLRGLGETVLTELRGAVAR
jgi:GAF domain-containing protein